MVQWLATLTSVPQGFGLNSWKSMGVCKCKLPLRNGDIPNSHRIAYLLVRLVKMEQKIRKTRAEMTLNEMFEKVSALLNCSTVSLEEFVAVDDDNACTARIVADKDIFKFVQCTKNIIDTDSDDKNEMNNVALVPTPSEMKNIMKNMHSYLNTDSNGEMGNKMDAIEHFVDTSMLKKIIERKISNCFPKTQ
ncbi:SCAN domain-containing protein 3 [Trichonephila clavipes]|nr:SCAN domain-containing protein 3 [Trichonephila clavipes]